MFRECVVCSAVSNFIFCSCLAAAKLGETIILDAEVIRSGRSIAFTKADLYRKADNTPIATALHTKAFPPQKK